MKKYKVLILTFFLISIYLSTLYSLSSFNYGAIPRFSLNQHLSTSAVTYNDTFISKKWGLFTVGANLAYERGINGTNVTDGNPIVIAVMDTGIDYDHPDLNDNYQPGGYDFVNGDADPYDDNSHGTHCAGIIAAEANNSIGVAGIAPEARIMAYKVLAANGSGNIDFLRQAIDHVIANYPPSNSNGVDIISMSLGVRIANYSLLSPGEKAVMDNLNNSINQAAALGIILVASSANDNERLVNYPAAFPNVIAIGATNILQKRASYSNYGPELEYMAPGGDWHIVLQIGIKSTVPGNPRGTQAYADKCGTSMAAPMAAGIVALLLSNGTKPADIRGNLTAISKNLGPPGWDEEHGHGLLQIVPNNWSYVQWFNENFIIPLLVFSMVAPDGTETRELIGTGVIAFLGILLPLFLVSDKLKK